MNDQVLIQATEEVLQQGLALLAGIDAAPYARIAADPFNASVGQHYRHVLDHFLCFLRGLENLEFNYDHRERDRRLETDLEYAEAATYELIRKFRTRNSSLLNQNCTVRYSIGYHNAEAERLSSTVGRELAFCVGHAVHHYAIVRLLCHTLRVEVVPEFGIAPSTLRHRAAQMAS